MQVCIRICVQHVGFCCVCACVCACVCVCCVSSVCVKCACACFVRGALCARAN